MLDMRRNFVRFISHEVRTPLNSLSMGLKLMKKGIENGESREEILNTLEEVREACEIAVETLNEILSYDKIESGLMVLEKTPVNADAFLKGTTHLFLMQVIQNIHF